MLLDTETLDKFYKPRDKQMSLTIRMPVWLHERLKRAAEIQTAIEEEVGEGRVSLNDTCLRALDIATEALCEEWKVEELPAKDSEEFAALVARAVKAWQKAT